MSDKKSIIIIDDEPSIRTLLSKILSLEGYSVTSFENSRKGLEEITKHFYNVALIDVILPDINGIELTKLIKEKSPDTEIIVMTAYATIRDGVTAMKNGAFDYIEKGKDEDEIILKVSQAAEKASLKNKVKHLQNKIEKNSGFAALNRLSPADRRFRARTGRPATRGEDRRPARDGGAVQQARDAGGV